MVEELSGVYKIKCIITGKFYIGSSYRIFNRFKKHISNLKCQKHCNRYLQNAWNKYGKDKFEWSILEKIELSDHSVLLEREQFWIDLERPFDRTIGYNLSECAVVTDSYLFSRCKSYYVTPPLGEEIEVTNLERFCIENGLGKSGLHKVANGEARQYKGWLCRIKEDTPEDWERRQRRQVKSGPYSGSWKITFLDNSFIEVASLNKWAKDAGHSLGTIHLYRTGKRKKYKDIKSVEKI